MNTKASPSTKSAVAKILLALPLTIALCAPAFAQGTFDTSTLRTEQFANAGYATPAPDGAAAVASNGATGQVNRGSYRTGEAPNSSGLSGNTSDYTGKQLGGLFNHLTLPYVSTGRMAPIFGYSSPPPTLPKYTTILDDPIVIKTGSSGSVGVDPSTGAVYTRQGGVSGSLGGIGSGSMNGSINLGGTNINLGGIGSGGINVGASGSGF
ncbi:MAG: hypothetical protein JSS86_06635 [Cyanobacteria bacterium SZAS LIN-2]|nr:hypothetical protein [Cyanobacteria bacterium SZAS LIN-3]MBS1995967.1 hypothetical protein [Cyanobacteria bacterium SZAS LIN-2]MBS2010039.1 hypothetical protein [Cyanobacteria bacterium SZAS TMP-1]